MQLTMLGAVVRFRAGVEFEVVAASLGIRSVGTAFGCKTRNVLDPANRKSMCLSSLLNNM